ncbi:hypothetical protein LPB90_10035 [Chryseobacterium sp. LC2016-29]|uniref:hypothetical protein n=1 Tax=Chryseobacterium sp. LC2016-29 TaxID=2897331 RepID=UPI001E5DCC61|nr:hypothetical protein [Chryseobacterium sp. LC2016-29]MCD0478800.1 hypothetical protein [Chryseobacterium sp. LC2016-29]
MIRYKDIDHIVDKILTETKCTIHTRSVVLKVINDMVVRLVGFSRDFSDLF